MPNCLHEEFMAQVDVNRIASEAKPDVASRFMADVRIHCAQCGVQMRFLGLPMGLDFNSPTINPDGTESRLPIHPVNEEVPGRREETLPSFKVINRREHGRDS